LERIPWPPSGCKQNRPRSIFEETGDRPAHQRMGAKGGCLIEKIHYARRFGYSADMFKEALQGAVDNTDGGLAGLLMDFEGIPVESYSRDGALFDIEAVGAEVSVVVKAIQRATAMLEAGNTREVSFKSEKMVTLIRVINDSYFVAMTLAPEGNFGKGRYMLRLLAPQLRTELE